MSYDLLKRRAVLGVAGALGLSVAVAGAASGASVTGPSTSTAPYLVGRQPGVVLKSVLSVGDPVPSATNPASTYRMAGIPDGLGAYDNGDGTFTVLMNHEIGNTLGVTRAHGGKGAFVSRWTIDKDSLEVTKGEDLVKDLRLWDKSTSQYVTITSPGSLATSRWSLSRLCSADLPAPTAFFNPETSKGYEGRLFMDGEESGVEGRAFAHDSSGPGSTYDGTSWELPALGKFAWENSVARPAASDKTVVVGLDDGTGGQVYVYVGDKQDSGLPIEKAGLANGKLYGIRVDGLRTETNASTLTTAAFDLADLGVVTNTTGASLEATSNATKVTNFQRPEDGSWDPSNPNDFYFVTTASFSGNSRLWRLRFVDPTDPSKGGTIERLINGPAAQTNPDGPKMMDNITVTRDGKVMIQEDPGADEPTTPTSAASQTARNAYVAKVWQYDIASGTLTEVAQHDPALFALNTGSLTVDEESSGIIPMDDILGRGKFLLDVQAHYPNGTELVEGGQLLVLQVPPGKFPKQGNTAS